MPRLTSALIGILLGLPLYVSAQDTPTDAENEVAAGSIEEVRVSGTRDLSEMRQELVEAEDNIYRVYNELNLDDDYDIICTRETRITSHFSQRVCKARLFREAAAESAKEYKDNDETLPIKLDHEYHGKILSQKMRNLAAANLQLRAALKKHRDLQQEYDAALAEEKK